MARGDHSGPGMGSPMKLEQLTYKQYVDLKERFVRWLREDMGQRIAEENPDLPTIREIGQRYNLSQADVRELVDDCEELALITGFRVGNGVADIKGGDQMVEFVGCDGE